MERAYGWVSGDIVDGRYLITRELGGGGMAHAYLAQALHLHEKRVVLKILQPAAAANDWQRVKFFHEREALARLDHPAIINIIDTGTTSSGEVYFVMPFVQGRSLLDVMTEGRPLNLLWIGELIRTTAHALSAAHEQGVIHRDIKPSNILLQALARGEEQIKIIDFGLVGLKDPEVKADSSSDGCPVGTIPYMPPWDWQEDDLSTARDTYSLGVVTYELITGQPPFYDRELHPQNGSLMSLFQAIRSQQNLGVRVEPKTLRAGLPNRAQAAILRALSYERDDNFSETRDFGDELLWALTDEPRSLSHPLTSPAIRETTTEAEVMRPPVAAITLANFRSAPGAAPMDFPTGSPGPTEDRYEKIGSPGRGAIESQADWLGSPAIGYPGDAPTGSPGPGYFAQNSHFFEQLNQPRANESSIPASRAAKLEPQFDTTLAPVTAISDVVDCTVFAPPAVSQGETFLVQVFAHRPEQAETAGKEARDFDESAQKRGFKSLEVEIERGSKLGFHLIVPGLEVDDPIQYLVWRGEAQPVQFGVTVADDKKPATVLGTVTVSQDHTPIGHIKFKLTVIEVGKETPESATLPTGEVAHTYKKAFISYASQDRREVLKRVQIMSRLGIKFFQDVLDLEPGVRWEKELYRHIDESDLFLLFWSNAAKQSKWVMEEVRYALRLQGEEHLAPPELIPVILEGPPPPSPPAELSHLHFNDYFIYFINAS